MSAKISIVIPVYNEEKDIENCIRSLGQQSYKDFEIIIVDDGSTDKTLEILKKFKKVNLIFGEHKGPGFSRNLGAKKANGKILVFIDADMTFDKDYLKNLIEPILKNDKIIGTTHNEEIAKNIDNIWSKLWGIERITEDYQKEPKIFRAIRRNKFLEMGGFDSKYGYADDQTFWFKFGIKPVFAKNTICYHNNPETLEDTFKQARWIGASWKERYRIFKIAGINYLVLGILWVSLPFLVLIKAINTKINGVSFENKIKFFWYKFRGYFAGVKKSLLKEEVCK